MSVDSNLIRMQLPTVVRRKLLLLLLLSALENLPRRLTGSRPTPRSFFASVSMFRTQINTTLWNVRCEK